VSALSQDYSMAMNQCRLSLAKIKRTSKINNIRRGCVTRDMDDTQTARHCSEGQRLTSASNVAFKPDKLGTSIRPSPGGAAMPVSNSDIARFARCWRDFLKYISLALSVQSSGSCSKVSANRADRFRRGVACREDAFSAPREKPLFESFLCPFSAEVRVC
jgi:hypothetical protein